MKSRQVGLLLAVIVVIGVVGLLFRLLSTDFLEENELSGLSQLDEEVIDRVVMTGTESEIAIVKQEDGWFLDEYPVFVAKLFIMWDTVSKFEGADLVSTNPENHWLMGVTPEHGTTVKFYSGDEMREELLIGDHFSGSIGMRQLSAWSQAVRMCYIRKPGEDDVYGMTCLFADNFAPTDREWKSPVVAQIPPEEIHYFTYEFRDGETFEVRPIEGGGWAVVSEFGAEAAREPVMNGILSVLQRFIASNVPTDEEMEQMSFDDPLLKIGVITRPDSETPSIQLLFTEKDDFSYYVKDASKSYAYVAESDPVFDLLSDRERFTTEPVYEGPIVPQPTTTAPASSTDSTATTTPSS